MKVSVLMATYNGAQYLCAQIDSILNQTYSDFDLYISDDGSKDCTLDILQEYAEKYMEKIHILKKNSSCGSAKINFLYLLENVESDLYFFCDQDDVWTENHIELFLQKYASLTSEEKGKPILIHSDLGVVDSELNMISESFFKYSNLPENPDRHFFFVMNNATGCVSMVNDSLKKYVFRNPELLRKNTEKIIMHDHLCAVIAMEFGTKLMIKQPTIFYRQHGNNVCGAGDGYTLKSFLKKIFSFNQYRISFNQYKTFALFFLNYFEDILSEEEKTVVRNFTEVSTKNKISRIIFLVRNNFLKASFIRNIWLFIVV